ncbi:hypothetical protein EZV62_003851 [Acer yangbiense]|uniref:Disease resistance N-terminal domain-containing protein n=1 Tax=Acer yangbiense TaxID=1000413 RepID=A0A5C7IKD2_9ROSI|nr:hypothetical protein EZV62_003851 [Acer yangbiense]
MADAIVSVVLEQLISIIGKETNEQVRLVVGVRKEIEKLTSNFRAIQAVLLDAERRGLKDTAARDWLDKLKNASYDMDDVLDEWNTALLKLQSERAESDHVLHKKKVCLSFPSPRVCFKQVGLRSDIAQKIKGINENIDSIAREKDMFNIVTSRSNEEPPRIKSTSFDVPVDFKKDDDDNIITCKMHDIVHDFAQFLVKNECFMMLTSSGEESSLSGLYENVRHSKLILDDVEASFPTNICSMSKLRSLLVERWTPSAYFNKGKNLRIDYLPNSTKVEDTAILRKISPLRLFLTTVTALSSSSHLL